MPALSVCSIVRNEAETLPMMLESVKGLADEIIIVDTGSTDDTIAVAKKYGAVVIESNWKDDFSYSRNIALEAAKSDWILILDADEKLTEESRDLIRQAMKSNHKAFLVNVFSVLPHEIMDILVSLPAIRLFRNNPKVRFSGRVHESVEQSLRKMTLSAANSQIEILHEGFTLSDSMRRLRNRRLFESELSNDPSNPWLRFHLGISYMLDKDIVRAEEYLNFVVTSQSSQITVGVRSIMLAFMSIFELDRGKIERARSLAARSSSMGGNLFATYIQSKIDVSNNALEASINKLSAIDTGSISRKEFRVNRGALYNEICQLYLKLKQPDKALQYAELSLSVNPKYQAMVIAGYITESKKDFAKSLSFYELAYQIQPSEDLSRKIESLRTLL